MQAVEYSATTDPGSYYTQTKLLNKADKPDKEMIKIIFSIYVKAHGNRKSNMKQKFFLQISDHQQSVAPDPSRGHLHTPNSAGGR